MDRRVRSHAGVGNSEIHSSLIVTLVLMGVAIACLSFLKPSFNEFLSASITLPLVWLSSLIVRIAAQQLAIGDFSHDSETTICPTGNLQTDYEYLPPRTILAYGLSGQLASVALVSIGLVVNAACTPHSGPITVSELLDFRGGFDSQAWATQILWVNVFLFAIHLLPTVPFDTRAIIFAISSWRTRTTQEPQVFRALGTLDSHLSAVFFGIGLTAFGLCWTFDIEIAVWYASLAAAVYLFVASQWEYARAEEMEEQYFKRLPKPRAHKPQLKPHLDFSIDSSDAAANEEEDFAAPSMNLGGLDEELFATGGDDSGNMEDFFVETDPHADVDEILRKVHRAGVSSLSKVEREALMIASREIKEKRDSD